MIPDINVDKHRGSVNIDDIKDPNDFKQKGFLHHNDPNHPQNTQAQFGAPTTGNIGPTGLNGNNSNVPLYKLNPHMVDPNNPNLPNVMLIVSPSMR
jgi:hypothetical protein